MENLTTFTYFSTVFADVSINTNNYDVDTLPYSMVNDSDYIYTGLYKNFKRLYIDIKDQTSSGELKLEYYNGTSWEVLKTTDETLSLSRSGFITWSQELSETEINSTDLFYIRLTGSFTGNLNGINLIFANDDDLKEHYRQINDYLGSDTSYIAYHQASRKDIIQKVRNSGNTKISAIDNRLSDLTVWDFLRPEQLRNAGAYLCLSKIFAGISDNVDGKFYSLSMDYNKLYCSAVETFLLTVDKNDDGSESGTEQSKAVKMTRIKTV